MLMSAVLAGGLPCAYSTSRDALNQSTQDGAYIANRGGLMEPDYGREMFDPLWPRQYDGKALKVVTPFIGRLAVHSYAVAFMRRDPEEIRQSYRGAFPRHKPLTVAGIEREVEEALRTLKNRRDVQDVVELSYPLTDPVLELSRLGWPIDVQRAAEVWDESQYRFRREVLTVGI